EQDMEIGRPSSGSKRYRFPMDIQAQASLFTERRSKDYVWRTAEEEFHPDCIDYARHPKGTGLMFWAVFRKGEMGPGLFFDLEKGESVNSTVYRDQILLGPLQQF